MSQLNYGARVAATAQYTRSYRDVDYKFWEAVPVAIEGIYLGTRRLCDGHINQSMYGANFCADHYHTAALVSPGPSKNPVFVPLDALKELAQ